MPGLVVCGRVCLLDALGGIGVDEVITPLSRLLTLRGLVGVIRLSIFYPFEVAPMPPPPGGGPRLKVQLCAENDVF
jgi:hypothetical protein